MREPFDDPDRQAFYAYARTALAAPVFDPVADDADEGPKAFQLSLASARAYMAEAFGRRNEQGALFRCYPAYVDLGSPNAFAAERADLHLCGIHSGLAVGLIELSLYAFAQKDFFTEIGNASGEQSPEMPSGGPLAFWIHDLTKERGVQDLSGIGRDFLPRDDARVIGAHLLAQLMLRFVWMHELFHCLNGHVGFRKQLGLASALHEMPDDASYISSALVELAENDLGMSFAQASHCLELDADRTALFVCLGIQAREQENIEGLQLLPLRLRLKMMLFAAMTLAYVFDTYDKRAGRVWSPTHPTADLRLHNIIRSAASQLRDLGVQNAGLFEDVLKEFKALRQRVPGLLDVNLLLQELRSPTVQQHHNQANIDLQHLRMRSMYYAYK